MTVRLSPTRSEQYMVYVGRAIDALRCDKLELATRCIAAAQYVVYDLELQSLDIEDGE